MPFWKQNGPIGNFTIHFTFRPKYDFANFGQGYALAAHNLARSYCERRPPDYEAYPIVFLYRHAIELYLKAIVVKGLDLLSLTRQRDLDQVTLDHNLHRLMQKARIVLVEAFPEDNEIDKFVADLEEAVRELDELDPNSYLFRYPVNKSWERPTSRLIWSESGQAGRVFGNRSHFTQGEVPHAAF